MLESSPVCCSCCAFCSSGSITLLLPPQVDRNGLPVPRRDPQESSRALFTHRVGSSPHRLDANPRVLCASDSASSSFPP